MKMLKKSVMFVLAMIMLMTAAMTAFADEGNDFWLSGSINGKNPVQNGSVSATMKVGDLAILYAYNREATVASSSNPAVATLVGFKGLGAMAPGFTITAKSAGNTQLHIAGPLGDYIINLTVAAGKQKITLKKPSYTFKASALAKKSKSFSIGAKASGNGKLTYKITKKVKGITINKAGRIIVAKGTPAGNYKVTVKITAAATRAGAKTTVSKKVNVIVK